MEVIAVSWMGSHAILGIVGARALLHDGAAAVASAGHWTSSTARFGHPVALIVLGVPHKAIRTFLSVG